MKTAIGSAARGLWSGRSASGRASFLVAAVLVILAASTSREIGRDQFYPELRQTAESRASLIGASLQAAIARYSYLPEVVSRTVEIKALFDPVAAGDDRGRATANEVLEATARSARASALFVMNATGLTLASSNWREPTSFVGSNYSFRPYFRDALAGRDGRYYAVGVTTGLAGYFLSTPIRRDGAVVGVAVVKIDLSPLEAEWSRAGEEVGIVADDGIVFLSSVPAWRYRPLVPDDTDPAARGGEERRYADIPLQDEPILDRPLGSGRPQPVLIGERPAVDRLVQVHDLSEAGWRIVYAANPAEVEWQTLQLSFAVLLAGGLMMALAAAGLQRRRAHRLERAAFAQLDRRLQERTQELAAANGRLEAEVEERARVERDLHRVRDELVQSAKLAALGQTLAGFAHEINQPLAALRTYLASTRLLIDKGRFDEAQENVVTMSDMLDRLRDLNERVKSLARRDSPSPGPANLGELVEQTAQLLKFRLKDEDARLQIDMPGRLTVAGSPRKFEQVVLNLLSNALDAVSGTETRLVRVAGRRLDGRVVLEVHDSGPGVPPELAERLFEPFFTTKDSGQGLGLGLAIAHRIVLDHGGTLDCRPSPLGGALFTVSIPVHLEAAA